MSTDSHRNERGVSSAVYTLAALAIIAAGVYGYIQYSTKHQAQLLELSPEAKQYVRNLKLTDVEIKAHESYLKQMVVAIEGKITNAGERAVQVVEIICVFYDPYNQVVLRQRVPIVSARMGGLKAGETKVFRLPFDELPESWNHQLPSLVIAGIQFQ
ncbi:MAG: DUF2393 family protein [Acidobacteria bacterium]|nr:DUF2393 family protein [Acidobacteriota bacterium]